MNELQKANDNPMMPKTFAQAEHYARLISTSGLCPPQFRGKPTDVLIAMQMGYEVGMNPMQAIQNVAVINNKPTFYGDMMMALVRRHPDLEYIHEEVIYTDDVKVATCTIKRKSEPKEAIRTFTEEDARTAKLWGKAGPWTQYPKRMLQMRARSWALRDKFADALAGFQCAEEVTDYPEQKEVKNVTPKKSMETVPIDVTPAPVKTIPEREAEYKAEEAEAKKIYETSRKIVEPKDDGDVPDLSKTTAGEKGPAKISSKHLKELEKDLMLRVVDTSKFYNHYEISKLEELTEKQAKNALKMLKEKPLKETVDE